MDLKKLSEGYRKCNDDVSKYYKYLDNKCKSRGVDYGMSKYLNKSHYEECFHFTYIHYNTDTMPSNIKNLFYDKK